MRRSAKIDKIQPEIVSIFKKNGFSVQSLGQVGNGCPDILVGFNGYNFIYEIKNNPKLKLNALQEIWHKSWLGQKMVLNSVKSANDEICRIKKVYDPRCKLCGIKVNYSNGLQFSDKEIEPYCNKCLARKISNTGGKK